MNTIASLERFPQTVRYCICDGNKRPIGAGWPKGIALESAIAQVNNGKAKAIGLVLGEVSGGILALDQDGPSAAELVDGELPPTVGVTSGKPGRFQLFYRVPERYWPHISHKVVKAKTTGEQLEFRWGREDRGHQSIVWGEHPETEGYRWLDGRSPEEIGIAEVPKWVLRHVVRFDRELPQDRREWSDREWAQSYLSSIPPAEDYETWVAVGMALKSVDPDLLDVWDVWSSLADNYKPSECKTKWESFKRDGVGIGTLGNLAKENGWKGRSPSVSHATPMKDAIANTDGEWGDRLVVLPVPPPDSPAGFYHRCKDAVFGNGYWLSWDGRLHRWNGTHYEAINQETIRRSAWEFAAGYEVKRYAKDGSEYSAFPYATPNHVKQSVEWLHLSCTVSEVNPPGINCENGFLELTWDGDRLTPKLSPHSPDRHVLSPPSCRFDPHADSGEYERLMQCLDPEPRDIWERTIAASLDLPTVRKYVGRSVKALLLKGDGANGKDTLRAICQQLFGPEAIANTSTIDWQAYENGICFKVASLRGKRLSWASETSDVGRIDKLQGLKAAITGDPITFEAKYKDGIKESPIAVFVFSINEMPNISNSLKAIETRWGLVPFNKTYSSNPRNGELQGDPRFKEDPNFIREQLLPAFLNRLLVQLQAVVMEGIDYSSTQGLLDEISRESNHLQQFAQDVGLTYDPSGRTPVLELWESLEQWYQDNGYLTYEEGARGSKKAIWSEPARKGDRLVKGIRMIVPELHKIFPKAQRAVEGGHGKTKTTYLLGVVFQHPVPPSARIPEQTSLDTAAEWGDLV